MVSDVIYIFFYFMNLSVNTFKVLTQHPGWAAICALAVVLHDADVVGQQNDVG